MNDPTAVYSTVESPVGDLVIEADGEGIRSITPASHRSRAAQPPGGRRDDEALADAREQLRAYFRGELHAFSLPLRPRGTPFQQRVWDLLQRIPYGSTTTYGTIARRLGKPTAGRAVGAANGRNPIAIAIPCHRVVGSDGSLTGYASGLGMKRSLLDLERRHADAR